MNTRKELLPTGLRPIRDHARATTAAGAGYDYPTTNVGTSGSVTVLCDPALGNAGLDLARRLLARVGAPYTNMETLFGITGGAFEVVLAPLSKLNDGSGGAYHYGCDFSSGGTAYLDATFASKDADPLELAVGLYVAELSESFMGPQRAGWNA